MLKISLAMTTYNGEKYILRQLETLRLQTRKIDEVIICDDCSSDKTAEIVKKYINDFNLVGWRFIANKSNLGFIENFKNAIKMTSGDIIFLCDQDDEWDINKVAFMAKKIEENSDVELLACSLRFINENSIPLVPSRVPNWYLNMESKKFGEMERIDFLEVCPTNYSPGCTMCFTRKVADEYLRHEYPFSIPHDWLISLIASSNNAFYYINNPLINYRIHSNNAIGVKSADKSKSAIEQIERMERFKSRYAIALGSTYSNIEQVEKNMHYISARIVFYKRRTVTDLINVWKTSCTVKGIYKKQYLVNLKDLLYLLHIVF